MRLLTEVKSALLLDVVVRKSAPIFELLAGEDEALLVGRDTSATIRIVISHRDTICSLDSDSPLLVLNLSLHIVDRVGGLDLEGDGLAGKGLHEDLHAVCAHNR